MAGIDVAIDKHTYNRDVMFRIHLFGQIILSISLYIAFVAREPTEKFLASNSSGKHWLRPRPFFVISYSSKISKIAFLAMMHSFCCNVFDYCHSKTLKLKHSKEFLQI